jgi:hypothetical protein
MDISQTLEKRVEQLERKVTELATHFTDRATRQKDWRRTFGLSQGDDGFKEMMRLGREYRQGLKGEGNDADP